MFERTEGWTERQTDRQMQATTIPLRPEGPRGKKAMERIFARFPQLELVGGSYDE